MTSLPASHSKQFTLMPHNLSAVLLLTFCMGKKRLWGAPAGPAVVDTVEGEPWLPVVCRAHSDPTLLIHTRFPDHDLTVLHAPHSGSPHHDFTVLCVPQAGSPDHSLPMLCVLRLAEHLSLPVTEISEVALNKCFCGQEPLLR